jgi:hypothetical protein
MNDLTMSSEKDSVQEDEFSNLKGKPRARVLLI